MSEVELVAQARRYADKKDATRDGASGIGTELLRLQADTIERLLKERDEARAEGDRRFEKESEWVAANREWAEKCRAAEAQVAALTEKNTRLLETVETAVKFNEGLSVQVAALTKALTEILNNVSDHMDHTCNCPDCKVTLPSAEQTARKALVIEDKK